MGTISDKVPGSSNPPSPLQDKGFNGMIVTTSPKMDYQLGNVQKATSPVANEVNPSANVEMMDIGQGVSGVINTENSVNVPSTATGHIGSFDFGVR